MNRQSCLLQKLKGKKSLKQEGEYNNFSCLLSSPVFYTSFLSLPNIQASLRVLKKWVLPPPPPASDNPLLPYLSWPVVDKSLSWPEIRLELEITCKCTEMEGLRAQASLAESTKVYPVFKPPCRSFSSLKPSFAQRVRSQANSQSCRHPGKRCLNWFSSHRMGK